MADEKLLNSWPIENANPTGTNLIALGDSLTWGDPVGTERAYPAHLARLIGRPILNRGVNGDTTAGARRRLARDVLSQDPRIVLICLGTNDLLSGHALSKSLDNLRRIIRQIQGLGALAILIGVENWIVPGSGDDPDGFMKLAREMGCVYVPDYSCGIVDDPALVADAIHPNEAGYTRVAERLAGEVGEYLRR